MATRRIKKLVGAAVRPRAAVVLRTTRGERAPILDLAPLRGRAAEGTATLGPLAAVEHLAALVRPALGLATLWTLVLSTRHDTRCRWEGPWRQG